MGKAAALPERRKRVGGPQAALNRFVQSCSRPSTVQARLRHASAKTTLDTYGHLWPDRDESTRAAVEAVFAARADSVRTSGGAL